MPGSNANQTGRMTRTNRMQRTGQLEQANRMQQMEGANRTGRTGQKLADGPKLADGGAGQMEQMKRTSQPDQPDQPDAMGRLDGPKLADGGVEPLADALLARGPVLLELIGGPGVAPLAHEAGPVLLDMLEQLEQVGLRPATDRFAARMADMAQEHGEDGLPAPVAHMARRAVLAAHAPGAPHELGVPDKQGKGKPRAPVTPVTQVTPVAARLAELAALREEWRGHPAMRDASNPTTRTAARGLDAALTTLMAHARGLVRAEADLVALREWAGVPVSGKLPDGKSPDGKSPDRKSPDGKSPDGKSPDRKSPDGQRAILRESVARGLEAYLREGKAPSARLAGVFCRMARWTASLYASARELGVEPGDEVRTVFDRMLATDAEIAAHPATQAALEREAAFLRALSVAVGGLQPAGAVGGLQPAGAMGGLQPAGAVGGLDPAGAVRLEDLRDAAETMTAVRMDAELLRDRANRLRGHLRQALHEVSGHPLWRMVDSLAATSGTGAKAGAKADVGRAGAAGQAGGIGATGAKAGGIGGVGLDRADLAARYGEDAVRALARRRPGLVRNAGGAALDDVARAYGWPDGEAAWNALFGALVLRGETKAGLARRMAAARLSVEDARTDPGAKLMEGPEYADYLEAVHGALARGAARAANVAGNVAGRRAAGRGAAGNVAGRDAAANVAGSAGGGNVAAPVPPRATVRAMALAEVESTPMHLVRPDRYTAALRSALGERDAAVRRGDLARALAANGRARLAAEMLGMAHRAADTAEALRDRARRLAGAGDDTHGAGHAAESARDIIIRRLRDGGIDPAEANIDAVSQRNRNGFQ